MIVTLRTFCKGPALVDYSVYVGSFVTSMT